MRDASRAARSVVPVLPEIRRLLAAILLGFAVAILAAAIAGCDSPRASVDCWRYNASANNTDDAIRLLDKCRELGISSPSAERGQ